MTPTGARRTTQRTHTYRNQLPVTGTGEIPSPTREKAERTATQCTHQGGPQPRPFGAPSPHQDIPRSGTLRGNIWLTRASAQTGTSRKYCLLHLLAWPRGRALPQKQHADMSLSPNCILLPVTICPICVLPLLSLLDLCGEKGQPGSQQRTKHQPPTPLPRPWQALRQTRQQNQQIHQATKRQMTWLLGRRGLAGSSGHGTRRATAALSSGRKNRGARAARAAALRRRNRLPTATATAGPPKGVPSGWALAAGTSPLSAGAGTSPLPAGAGTSPLPRRGRRRRARLRILRRAYRDRSTPSRGALRSP